MRQVLQALNRVCSAVFSANTICAFKSSNTMDFQVVILVLALLGLSSALVCPDGGMCEDRNTCCKNTVGGYGCCPLPHAECCADHLHCCYEGTLCDLVHKKCVNKTVSLPWLRRLPAKQAFSVSQLSESLKVVVCPGDDATCPDNSTCCQLHGGNWGCCPLPKAVCCGDKHHCCPEATTCDITKQKCVSASLESFPMLEKLPALQNKDNSDEGVVSVTCPGGKSSCPDSYTCCLLTSGDYGCCPYTEAVCCSDQLHCCPSHTECDVKRGVCRSAQTIVPLLKKVPAVPNDVKCPDKKTACPDQTTCCQMTNGSYGCCPMPNAVCCSDHMHCCPEGTMCDLRHSTCVSTQGNTVTMASEVNAAVTELVLPQLSDASVPCNESVACADGKTCCKKKQGDWGCCPLPEAVCCEDHLHCCPHGTICNLAASTCDDPTYNTAVTPWLRNEPAFSLQSDNNKCDETTSCPGNSTCCGAAGGEWACCPLAEAQTCKDPFGFVPSISWMKKLSPLTIKVGNENCDGQTMCPGGTTCCKKTSGLWACCPLPQAVCCSDQEHCCPKGYKCNVAQQTCDKPGGLTLPWLLKVPALQREPTRAVSLPAQLARKMCDSNTSCPKDTTCCFMEQTQKWGCCPLPTAVCCSDGVHCCPNGHTCEPHKWSCSRGPHVIPWFTKLSAYSEPDSVTDVKCDNKSSCAAGTTCCKLPTGEWGCCPLVKAVCCEDHQHCCPQGYTCNMKTGTCDKKDKNVLTHTLHQIKVVQPQSQFSEDDVGVPCDSTGDLQCSKSETCCKTSPSGWACCPSPQAVCCSDSKYCCPAGFTCDSRTASCSRINSNQLSWDTFFGDKRRDFVPRGL
ncbi:granulin b isoform X2 [Cynoglossus semilaevis]|uniref:granulin b isoform X2 n=1 Tax=Cynoglossus semilaevis TaxID=244447 RepID=UPI000D628A1A|nr:granulins isoform X2 [Cynoglossus semilaevis]